MHAETLAYILHNLAYEQKVGPPTGPPARPAARPVQQMSRHPRGRRPRLGRDPEEGFGWDNEFRAHRVHVPAFSISRYKVTNGDYLEFVREGAETPFFWVERNGRWFCRGHVLLGNSPCRSIARCT